MEMPEGQVLVGARIADPSGYWFSPKLISEVDLRHIQGYNYFVNSSGSLFPSDFLWESRTAPRDISCEFLQEVTDCIKRYHAEHVLGLQTIPQWRGKMIEFRQALVTC